MRTYFRLLSFAKPIEKFAIPYVLCMVLTVIFSTLNLALLAPLLTIIFNSGSPEAVAKPGSWLDPVGQLMYYSREAIQQFGQVGALKIVCAIIIVSVLLSNVFRYISQRIMENLKIHTLLNLRKTVFDNVMDLHVGYFNNQRKGDIISKISADVQVVQFSVTATLQVVFKEPLQLLAFLFMLFAISVKLTLFSMLVIPVSAFFISLIVKKLKQQATESQQLYGKMISLLDEALSGIKIIKAFNATQFTKDRFNNENIRYSKVGRRMVRRQQLGSPVSEFLGVVMVTMIVFYGGQMVLRGDAGLDAAAFITYIGIFSQIMRPAKALTDSFSNIHTGIAAGERVLHLIDEKPAITDRPGAIALHDFGEHILLENVSFSYPGRPVLKNINLRIPKGQTIALVGPSGGGKSTLMDLLPRFIEPQEGRILIDGHDIQWVTMDSLRALMGVVNQESILFNDTIFNNIAFGKADATAEQVETAARIANAHDFIIATEKGYRTNIGDRGVRLSGGQKQRICIARAVLKNPPVLLLDEATSALDTESEKLVQEALNNLMKNRTSLVIAHRLSTIQQANRILVLAEGEIAEEGTHNELMARHGMYRKLIEMQALQ